jgi:hypothetical protein
MAVRALEDRLAPEGAEALDGQLLVDHAGDQQDPAGVDGRVADGDPEGAAVAGDGGDPGVADLDVGVLAELLASDAADLVRRGAVAGEEVVHVLGGGVAARASVAEEDTLAGAAERQGGGEAAGATSHDDDVVHVGAPRGSDGWRR